MCTKMCFPRIGGNRKREIRSQIKHMVLEFEWSWDLNVFMEVHSFFFIEQT